MLLMNNIRVIKMMVVKFWRI